MLEFGEILREENRLIDVEDEGHYLCGGVRLHGRGVFVREEKRGVELKKKFVQHLVREGDIVYSTLFAKAGAFAVADASVDGVVLSEKFPTFVLKSDAISLDYLRWLFRSGQLNRIAETQMTGIAAFSLSHLSKKKFLRMRVPAPSKERQREVVQLCEAATVETQRALGPLRHNVSAIDHLSAIAIEQACEGLRERAMSEIGEYVIRPASIVPEESYRQITVAMKNRGLRLRRECFGADIKSPGQSFVKEGDLLFSRIDIRQGAIGFVPSDLEGAVVTRDFPIFGLNEPSEINRRFLNYVFRSAGFVRQAQEGSRGTTGRKKMKRPAFLGMHIPWGTAPQRAEVVSRLDLVSRASAAASQASQRQQLMVRGLCAAIVQKQFALDSGLM